MIKLQIEIEQIAKQFNINVEFTESGKLDERSLFQDKVKWYYISSNQTLSEGFIREFQDKVDWYYISSNQTLSEGFIREFKNKVKWNNISSDQTLSEGFIREFKDKVYWDGISKYQRLSLAFRKEFNIVIPDTCWLYKSTKSKLEYIKANTTYKVIDNKYIEAYKTVKSNMESVYKCGFSYEVGKTYTSHCDCNIGNENSFGLSAWTKEKALEYHKNGILLKVLIPIKDIGVIVHNNGKIRTRSLKVL